MKDFDVSKNIILFDSSCNLENLKKLTNKQSCIIISFDYNSHKLLLENNIKHEISDNFINENDLSEIQNRSYYFANWCNDVSISNIIQYEEINLGNLFFYEFSFFLVPFLKKFLEITKIYQKFPIANYFTTKHLLPFISIHSKNIHKINFQQISIQHDLPSINYGFKIGGKNFSISFSDKYYQKIKSFSEIILKNSFPQNINKNQKTILLSEISPTRFNHFFSNIPQSNLNVVLHNRRFPSVWNIASYSLLKRSKCIVTSNNNLMDKNTKKLINKNIKIIDSQINELWNNDSFFQNFFIFNQISFWSILKPFFKNMFTDKLSEYIYEIELTKKLFAKYSFSSVLIVSEVSPNSQIIINLAKKFGVKIALIQHGMYADAFPETFQYNKSGVLPNLSDKFLVWGEVLKKYSIDCGISSDKIQIIGNPAYDDFFKQSKEGLSDNSYILLTTTFTQHDIVYDLTMNSRLQRKKIIEHICHTVTKLKRKLVIKLHPTFDDDNITDFVHKINPEIIIIKSGDVLDLIKNCEFLITLDMSTTILEAQILNKPALSMFVTDRKFGISEVFKSASCISVTNDLEKILIKLINNDQFKNDLISNGKKFSQKYLSHQGTSSKNLISFLEDF
jgi:hypothetical protein